MENENDILSIVAMGLPDSIAGKSMDLDALLLFEALGAGPGDTVGDDVGAIVLPLLDDLDVLRDLLPLLEALPSGPGTAVGEAELVGGMVGESTGGGDGAGVSGATGDGVGLMVIVGGIVRPQASLMAAWSASSHCPSTSLQHPPESDAIPVTITLPSPEPADLQAPSLLHEL